MLLMLGHNQTARGADIDMGKLNNILMQLRKNCNHPDLITSEWEQSPMFPPADVLVKQCGKMQVLDRLLDRLHAAGHKVLIFSQVPPPCLRPGACILLMSSRATYMWSLVILNHTWVVPQVLIGMTADSGLLWYLFRTVGVPYSGHLAILVSDVSPQADAFCHAVHTHDGPAGCILGGPRAPCRTHRRDHELPEAHGSHR